MRDLHIRRTFAADRVYMQVMACVSYIVIDMPAELPSLTKGFSSYILAIAHCAQACKKVSNGKLYSGLRSQHIDSAKKQLKIPTVTTFGALSYTLARQCNRKYVARVWPG